MTKRKKQILAVATKDGPHKLNKRLDEIIARLIEHMESARQTFAEYCKAATEEGFNPTDSWNYIRKRLDGVIPERTLHHWADIYLPLGSKRRYHSEKTANWQFAESERSPEIEQSDEGENEDLETPISDEDLGEPPEIWQIKPEEYRIEEVERYDRPFLIKLVKYLHNKIPATATSTTTTTGASSSNNKKRGRPKKNE